MPWPCNTVPPIDQSDCNMTSFKLVIYCMTKRAIQGNIQFEGGSIGPTMARDFLQVHLKPEDSSFTCIITFITIVC